MSHNIHTPREKLQKNQKRSQPVPLREEEAFPQSSHLSSEVEQTKLNPTSLSPTVIMQLQRIMGNQAVQRLLRSQDHRQETTKSKPNYQPFPWLGVTPTTDSEMMQYQRAGDGGNTHNPVSPMIRQTASPIIQLWPLDDGTVGPHPDDWNWFRCHDAVLYWLLADAFGRDTAHRIMLRIIQVAPASPTRGGDVLGCATAPRAQQGAIEVGDVLFFGNPIQPNHTVYVTQLGPPIQIRGFNNGGTFGGPSMQYSTEMMQELIVDEDTQNLSYLTPNGLVPIWRISASTARGNIAAFMSNNNIGTD